MIFFDTETCGLHGPIVLLQYAIDDGPIEIIDIWKKTIDETQEILESLLTQPICGFNLAFDWFHVCQMYTTLMQMEQNSVDLNTPLEDLIEEYYEAEKVAHNLNICLKPQAACDLMLHARKGPYQSLMDRKGIRVKRVPTAVAFEVAKELTERIVLPDVYFARYSDPTRRWQVNDTKDENPNFKDIVLEFAPSSALKALAVDALGVKDIARYYDVEVSKEFMPEELGYKPYGGTWPKVIKKHIDHWIYNDKARQYANDDVKYTRDLYKYFGSPEPGDVDSELACMVGASRWRGFEIDVAGLQKLKEQSLARTVNTPINYNSTAQCRKYIEDCLQPEERGVLKNNNGEITTKATVLEEISRWTQSVVCPDCSGLNEDCVRCGGSGVIDTDEKHPAAERAKNILDYRRATKEVELYDKLLTAGKFHASFVVIGTRSNRMAGSDDLNAQGIKRSKEVRTQFPLSHNGYVLCGGDFDSFEVNLLVEIFQDPVMRGDATSGRSLHGIFGTFLFPGMTYEDIIATKGNSDEADKYTRSKNGVFALAYGGEDYTLVTRVGVSAKAAENAFQKWSERYKVWSAKRREYFNMFCSMRQPGGIGSKVEWHEPHDYIETIFGFRRYFTLENKVCKALYDLAQHPTKKMLELGKNIKIVRRQERGVQTACGAVQSALYAAAFALQGANMRAAANHVIQSTGATITKKLQHAIWDIQPIGIHKWYVQPLNVHDEIMCVTHPGRVNIVAETVNSFIENMQAQLPTLSMTWKTGMSTWADK